VLLDQVQQSPGAPRKVGVTAAESGTHNDFTNINIGGLKADGSDGVNGLLPSPGGDRGCGAASTAEQTRSWYCFTAGEDTQRRRSGQGMRVRARDPSASAAAAALGARMESVAGRPHLNYNEGAAREGAADGDTRAR
jgi:hypothetical protein